MEDENKLQKVTPSSASIFSNIKAFEDGQRIASALSKAELVPTAYRNNIPNTMIALEMANRIGVSAFMVMQNLDVIKGKPSWSSAFIIAVLNSCGRFSPLRFKFEGEPKTNEYGCRAIAKDLESGEMLVGPLVNWTMVKAEGWLDKLGSKWKTMPELMFQYRSASFFGRLYAPDILKGMHSVEEIIDISNINENIHESQLKEINELLENENVHIEEEDSLNFQRIVDQKETSSYAKVLRHLQSKLPKDE